MKLLKSLYAIHSPSHKEGRMVKFICDWLTEKNIPFTVDQHNNVLATKNGNKDSTYPVVVCHTDQVQSAYPADIKIKQEGDVIYSFSETTMGMVGLGADDKNGIWIAMKVLEKVNHAKAAFFVGEECGCVGSSQVDMEFFKDARFVIQCDRRGGYDFITEASGVALCSEDFMKKMNASAFGYKKAYGMMTDVMELRRRGLAVCCCNLSCGYYEPHTKNEVTRVSELRNCLAMVLWACKNIAEVQAMEIYKPRTYSYDRYRSTFEHSQPARTQVTVTAGKPQVVNPNALQRTDITKRKESSDLYMDKPWFWYGNTWMVEEAYKEAQYHHAPHWILNAIARIPDTRTTLSRAVKNKFLTEWELRNILEYIDEGYTELVGSYVYADSWC